MYSVKNVGGWEDGSVVKHILLFMCLLSYTHIRQLVASWNSSCRITRHLFSKGI